MWFRLKLADWTDTGNLGTMDEISGSWTVTCNTTGGIVKTTGNGMIEKGGTWTGTFTLSEGAEFTSATLTPSTAGTVTSTPSGSTVTITIANVSANCTLSVVATGGSVEPETPVNYTFTINPTPTSATVTLSATGYSTVSGTGSKSITVANGTSVSWSVSASGYTTQSGTWTASKNENKNIILSQAVVAGSTIFDFDFANNTLDKYVTDGIITIPSTSTTDTVTYSTKGITTTGTATPACLGNGVKLTTPFNIGSTDWTFEVTMTLDPWQESFGMTEALYKNLVFVSADEHDTEAEYAHASNCLAPAIYIDAGGLSLRGPDNGGTTKKTASLFNPDGVEHTYKLSYNKDTDELFYYVDGLQKQKLAANGAVGGTVQYLLGVHKGYSSAKNFALKMGMHVRLMKMYTE